MLGVLKTGEHAADRVSSTMRLYLFGSSLFVVSWSENFDSTHGPRTYAVDGRGNPK